MKAFLASRGVYPSLYTYFVTALSYMALGLFSSLIIGLILQTIGDQTGLGWLSETGTLTMAMLGPAIGAAVSYSLKAPSLVLFSAVATGAAGAELGGPAGAFLATVIATELGKLVSQQTRLDIVLTPLVTVLSGFAVSWVAGPAIDSGMRGLGQIIMWATDQQPLVMSIVVASLMGIALTLPISSAAIAVMLDLSGLAAGAATIGCAAQMIGFAVTGYRENGWGGVISLGLGTSMLQVPNIVRNPLLFIPPTVAGAVLAPVATVGFAMEGNAAGAGMGTSGFVGPLMTIETMGLSTEVLLLIAAFHFALPALVTWVVYLPMRRMSWIGANDQLIRQE